MPFSSKRSLLLPALLLCALLLCGCGAPSAQPGVQATETARFPKNSTEVTAVLTAEELSLLDALPKLERADLSGSTCYREMAAWAAAHPQVQLRYTVPLPDGRTVDNQTASLDLSALRHDQAPGTLTLLSWLPALRTVNLGGVGMNDLTPEDVYAFTSAFPLISFSYPILFQGQTLSADTQVLDLSRCTDAELQPLLPWLGRLTGLRTVELGEGGDASDSRISWESVRLLRERCPAAKLNYRFTLYGRSLDLDTTELDLNHLDIYDQGELVKAVARCMPNLSYLDMDFCGVDDEHMAAIRDALPNTKVVWRIWIGTGYSVRTDVDRIVASNPGKGGDLTPESAYPLRYCTKVKYLDLGHNTILGNIDFCAYMPELEVVILAMADWSDISPLAHCPKLEYAELQASALNDLSPLKGLTNLRHLNICHCFALHDMTALYEMHNLERLWIGMYTPIPTEQIETFRQLNPGCTVDVESVDPTQSYWRYLGMNDFGGYDMDPRYALLRQQFHYDEGMGCYAYIENDPLYYPHG